MHRKQPDPPQLHAISRREFLVLSASAGATAVLTVTPLPARGPSASHGHRVDLSHQPSHNPAFQVRVTADDGLLLWTRKGDGTFLGFRVNSAGRALWRLCDGATPSARIAQSWAATTGRSEQEAGSFVEELLGRGILAAGGHVVTAGGFPHPGDGGCYRLRLSPEDPVSG